MARLGRYFIPGQPLHVIQRGDDRHAVFFTRDDYSRYREWLVPVLVKVLDRVHQDDLGNSTIFRVHSAGDAVCPALDKIVAASASPLCVNGSYRP
jgi:hypothetical protein